MFRRLTPFGPLVRWELVRLARQGHVTRARVLLLYAMLLAVVGYAVVKSVWSSPGDPTHLLRGSGSAISVAAAAELVESLVLVLLAAQLLLVAALTPAYTAASIAEEKDRHTLAALLTTDLTDREIVWGKAIARVLFVLAAVVAGIPVFAFALLFGEVNGWLLVAGYALTVGTVVLSAAIGVSAGCHAPDTRTALIRAYVQSALLVGGVLIPPLAMLRYSRLPYEEPAILTLFGVVYPLGQCAIAWVLLNEATRGLRKAGPTAGPPVPTIYPEPPRGRLPPLAFSLHSSPPPLPPMRDTDPVLWKERHAGRTLLLPMLDRPVRILGAAVAVFALALFVGGGWQLVKRAAHALDPNAAGQLLRPGMDAPDHAGAMLVAAGVFASALYLFPLAASVTGCVAGERFRGTLDSLLTTTLSRHAILWAKLRAHSEQGLVFAAGAATALGCGFGADRGVKFGLVTVAVFAAGVALVAGVGAWLSVRCAAPVPAFRLCLPVVVALIALPVVVWTLTKPADTAWVMPALLWTTAAFALVGTAFGWRAGVELERGE